MVRPPITLLLAALAATAFGTVEAKEAATFYRDSTQLTPEPIAWLSGLPGKVLSRNPSTGRIALDANIPAGFRERRVVAVPGMSFETYVLSGELDVGRERLGAGDFAYSPADHPRPKLASRGGARALLYFDPAPRDAEVRRKLAALGSYVTRDSAARWNTGSLSQSAGFDLDLEIKHLKKDPLSGARTWLVRLAPPVNMPFEVHSVVEEGYLLQGRYQQPECTADGLLDGQYRVGGYFYRPGGIPHSGPGSGPLETSVWLLRTPADLDVLFFANCERTQLSNRVASDSTVKREVTDLLARWAAASNASRWDELPAMWADDPRFSWVENGRVAYPSRAAAIAGIEAGRRSGASVTLKLADVVVDPLGSEVAMARAAYEMSFKLGKDAKPIEIAGMFTATAVFRERRWQFIQGHLSPKR